MKRIMLMLVALAGLLSMTSCDNYETYGEKKDKERDAIRNFIKRKGIVRIDETKFHQQGNTTDTTANEYVYLNNSGVYMQIVRKGTGTSLANNSPTDLKIRFYEECIMDSNAVLTNYYDPYDPDIMNITRTGSEYKAYFTSGLMNQYYGSNVLTGWLVPFDYISLGWPTADEDIAKVRLIVPHSKGHTTASSNVYPYFYEITFQR